jgi:hypothetical protein
MYIRAKYPKVGNEFGGSQAAPQGFGSLYGGNHTSEVENILRNEEISVQHDSDFGK